MNKTISLLLALGSLAVAQPAAADNSGAIHEREADAATCTTPYSAGVPGGWGHRVDGCTVRVPCPPTAGTCVARSTASIDTGPLPHRVTLESRMLSHEPAGRAQWSRDVMCVELNWCMARDGASIRAGDTAVVRCAGVRESLPGTARVRCHVELDY
jgi:hypothetical protein